MMDKDEAIRKLAKKLANRCKECSARNSKHCESCILEYMINVMVEEVEDYAIY